MNPPRTWSRYVLDVIFGVIVPAVCFYFDPLVVKTIIPYSLPMTCSDPLLGRTSAFWVYPAAGIGMLSLLCWLILGRRLSKWAAYFLGVLGAGVLAALIPAILLTTSTIFLGVPAGLIVFVYGRSASEAWSFAEPANKWMLLLRALGGLALLLSFVGIAYLLLQNLPPPVAGLHCKTLFGND
jgi:hypothetical protein